MNVSCPACASVFRVDPQKVPADGVRARCSVCAGVFDVPGPLARTRPPVHPAAPARAGEAAYAHAVPPMPPPEVPPVPDAPPPAPPDAVGSPSARERLEGARVGHAPATPVLAAGEARRPFNPYLSNEPGQKARRLARALVSDLVAYHPQKREEGLQAGTLKQLFREEIRKSWEEYVEQVGRPLAESTTHFQDALNDVLAGGRKVF